MDPLTHTLTGALLADTGIARRTPLAATTLILAANLPDVDALTYLAGADTALALRRGWTHGVLAAALAPVLLAAAIVFVEQRWRRRAAGRVLPAAASFGDLVPLAYLGWATHPFLDWLNTYGIRLLMPFDDRWFFGDTLFIIDPWLWLGLGGTVFLGHSRSRRAQLAWASLAIVTTAVFVLGSAGRPGARAAWLTGLLIVIALRSRGALAARSHIYLARGTLIAAGLYIAVLFAGSTLARRDVEAQLTAVGGRDLDIMVGPLPIRPLFHAVVVDTGERYLTGSYDWFSEPRLLLDRRPLSKPPWIEVVAAAFRAPCLRGMVRWVRYPWVEIEPTEDGGHVVHLMDARYTRSRTSGFGGGSVRLHPDLTDACEEHRP